MRIKTLAIAAIALLGLAAPASAGAVTLIGSGSVAAQPVLQALFATYTKKVNHKVHFVYTANGGNAGVKDVQNGTSQFAGQARTPLPSDAGTTYIKMFLDGLCLDVNPKNPLSNITHPADPRHLPRADHQLEPGARLGPGHDHRPGRPRHQRRDLQLLPPGGAQQRSRRRPTSTR